MGKGVSVVVAAAVIVLSSADTSPLINMPMINGCVFVVWPKEALSAMA